MAKEMLKLLIMGEIEKVRRYAWHCYRVGTPELSWRFGGLELDPDGTLVYEALELW